MLDRDERLALAERFIAACPVGWGMDSGWEELTRLEDHWEMREEDLTWTGGTTEAAEFLLNVMGFADAEGIADLQQRLETGVMGGGL